MKNILLALVIGITLAGCASTGSERSQNRRQKSADYMEFMDSVIMSGEFTFRPNYFYVAPSGKRQRINNSNFRMEFREDVIYANLPYYVGITPPYRIMIMDYPLGYIDDYTVSRKNDQTLVVTFSSEAFRSDTYRYNLSVNTVTGNGELTIQSPFGTATTYIGNIRAVY